MATAGLKAIPNGLTGYQKLVEDAYFPMKFSLREKDPGFCSKAVSHEVGSIVMTRVYAPGNYEGHLDLKQGASTAGGRFVLNLTEGGGVCFNGRRNTVTKPGDLTVLSPNRAVEVQQLDPAQSLAMLLPQKPMVLQYGSIDDFAFMPVDSSFGAAAILRETMQCYWRQMGNIDPASSSELVNVILNLIGAVFCRSHEGPASASLSMRAHFLRIRDLILEEMANENLSADYISRALGISKSHIFAIMNSANTTLGKFIMEQRLERARRLLEMPSARKRSISEVAFSVGFQELSHFSRRFSEAFGKSPKAYRNDAIRAS